MELFIGSGASTAPDTVSEKGRLGAPILLVFWLRQKSDASWEFRKIENEHIKTAQNNSYGLKNCVKLLIYV